MSFDDKRIDESVLPELTAARGNRRGFLNRASLLTLGAAGAAYGIQGVGTAHAQVTDADIANFALNLEYLEAEFYLRAAFGRGLSDSDTTGTGTRGRVDGGRQVNFDTDAFRQYAEEIANDEEAHVRVLRSALGEAAVARPKIDINRAFTTAARAAGLVGEYQHFDAYANEQNFLLAAFIFEDVGVTAYNGAAPLIMSKTVLGVAASILAVEAYHAGSIRTLLFGLGQQDAAQAISDLRDSADGEDDLDQGITMDGQANIIPADENALAFARTTDQVLQIVYLGGAAANFGFFPDRLNGTIR